VTPSTEIDLSIVIPAYKESAKIERDIRAASEFLKKAEITGEIVVVDDGSPDDTAAVAAGLRAEFPNLVVLAYKPNRGKGHAVRYGMLRAQGRIVMFADSGLCVPFDIATIGMAMIDMNMCDIAHGSRRMRGSVVVAQPLYRRLGSRAYKMFVHGVMGIPLYVSDTQCGFKLYRRDVARALYEAAFTDGFMFDTEIIMRALRANYRLLEFPVLWSNDADTRYDPIRGTIRNLRELSKLRLRLSPLAQKALPPREPVTEATFEPREAGRETTAPSPT
jgi:glycosyltransferase involved in cell wall biosynthesis